MRYSSALTCAVVAFFSAAFLTGCGCDEADGPARIKINNVTSAEGDAGTTEFVFTVTLTSDPGADVTVDYATSDGTATTADNDYVSTSGTITFTTRSGMIFVGGGAQAQTVTVRARGDTDMEPAETFHVDLSNPSNATISDGLGIGTIQNDDAMRVDPTGDGMNGLTWATAFRTVQEGVDAAFAAGGGEVWVAAATYANGGGTGPVVTMAAGVHMYGGFEGYAGGSGAQETTCSERDWSANVTTLDGEDNAYHVVIGADSATLDGFTVTRGNANGAGWPDDCGGGMHNYNFSSPSVTNCTFSGNAADEGGGMYNYRYSSPTVTSCTFSGDSADFGGGICNAWRASPTVANCTFSGNSVTLFGGGMYNYDYSSPTVTDCTFSGNFADLRGGGMLNCEDSSPTVSDCTFSGNSADWDGGGMCNYDYCSPSITNCTFWANSAADCGGGMYNGYNCSPTVTDCTFSGNFADLRGGGMYNWWYPSPTVTNCTFSGNSAQYGSGMYNGLDSSPTVTNCTFSRNSADYGGGILNNSCSPSVTNCIMWGDTAVTSGPEIHNSPTSSVSVRYSDIAGCGGSGAGWDATIGTDGGGNIDSAPQFVDADGADNVYGTADDDLHLSTGSPCIDSADGAAAPPTDIEGNPRYDDPGSPNTGVGPPWADMGAYEYTE